MTEPLDLRAEENIASYASASSLPQLKRVIGGHIALLAYCRALRTALIERNLGMQELANRAEELALFASEQDKAEVLRLVELWRRSQPAAVLAQARDE